MLTKAGLVAALPFFFAALAQLFAGLVQLFGDSLTRAHFERVSRAPATPSAESETPPPSREALTAGDLVTDDYDVDSIMSVVSKNTEGIVGLTGGITLAAAALAIHLKGGGILYALEVLLPVLAGLVAAIYYWFIDARQYREIRWFQLSRTVVVIAVLNVVLGIVVAFTHKD